MPDGGLCQPCGTKKRLLPKGFAGKTPYLKKGYLPRTPSSPNFQRITFIVTGKSNSNLFYIISNSPVMTYDTPMIQLKQQKKTVAHLF
ncbi:MAG: hypothetical protein IJC73_05635 [Lentisphaeria bacterium]|nr:hypothetical protein [Lentisphaeria bacterium]